MSHHEFTERMVHYPKVNLFEVLERCRNLIRLKGEADIESLLHTFNDTSSPAVAQIVKSLRYRMEDCNYVFHISMKV